MYEEKNKNMVKLIRMSAEADKVALDARRIASQAEKKATEITELYQGIRSELEVIKAKKLLKIRLAERERAVWILYGKETQK